MEKIVVLTGAGVSAESGLGTFREKGGIWSQHRIEDVATPQGFARDPARVHEFYNQRRRNAAKANPNAAHRALGRLQQNWPGEVVIVTQNVDALHEAGGAANVLHMHGRLDGALCAACNHRWDAPMEMTVGHPCPACNAPSGRPDIVWFGEMPYHMEEIYGHLASADMFAAIGTSGHVHPAASFVQETSATGARTIEINLEPSQVSTHFDQTRTGLATELVPQWVGEILTRRVVNG